MIQINKLKYHIFHPQNPFNSSSLKISDQAYSFWTKFWKNFYESQNIKEEVKKDSFIKQDIIAAITYEGEVIGIHLYTLYNLDSFVCADNPYLLAMPPEKFSQFKEHNLTTGMAMEYLSVNPEFRKSKTGVRFGDILIALGLKLIQEISIDCVFGIARSDVKVSKASQGFGGINFYDNITMHGFPCSFMVIPKESSKNHPEPFTQKLIDHLWNQKNSYLNYNTTIALEDAA